ncbi:MAG: hypothetical protein KIT17_10645 [Rubrivivax sp.]|nr:hypothetical protein [Rubrivivax sp.]
MSRTEAQVPGAVAAASDAAADLPPPLAALARAIGAASDEEQLVAAAAGIVETAAGVLDSLEAAAATAAAPAAAEAHGQTAALTAAITELNDRVSTAAVRLVAASEGRDLGRACWLAFGSQARSEQTLLTDQDNGLVFAARDEADARAQRPAWLAFGRRVNELLARCGYPLCDGQLMAGQPPCCLSPAEWCQRFEHWLAHGDGNALFAARIYFDVRAVAGDVALAQPLLELLRSSAAAVPRFVKQMADVVLCNHVPLNWLGRVVTRRHEGIDAFDLKTGGTTLFVDAGRLWNLAHRLGETGTVRRLRAAARAMRVPAGEADEWMQGFLALQRLRLQVQRRQLGGADLSQRAWVGWDRLDAAQREALRRSLRAARLVQQRIELDYRR